MEKKNNFVYITTNLIDGKQYIGDHSTNNIDDGYLGSGAYLKSATKKYKKENFKREILEFFDTKQEAFDAQEKYIQEYNTLVPNGYNISDKGGYGVPSAHLHEETKTKIKNKLLGVKHTKERRENQSRASTGRKYSKERCEKQSRSMMGKNKGKKTSSKTRKKISEAQIGRIHSEKTRKKMSESHKGKTHKPFSKQAKINISNAHKGLKLSTQHKQNISDGLKNRKFSDEHKQNLKNAWIKRKAKLNEKLHKMITKEQFNAACNKFKPNDLIKFMFRYFSTNTAEKDKYITKWLVIILVSTFLLAYVGTIIGVPRIFIGIPTYTLGAFLLVVAMLKFYSKIANDARIKKIMKELGIKSKLEYEALKEKYS